MLKKFFNLISLKLLGVVFLTLLFVFPMSYGCTLKRYGNPENVTYFKITEPQGLVGLKKSQIIERLGVPEKQLVDENGDEYWRYENEQYYFIIAVGEGKQKDLVLRIRNNTVTESRLIETSKTFELKPLGLFSQ